MKEAEDTLSAIRSGEVDALVVSGVGGEQIFTLTGAERPYRMLIEDMNEGALILEMDGVILYANNRFAEMLKMPLENVIGSMIYTWITPDNHGSSRALLQKRSRQERPRGIVSHRQRRNTSACQSFGEIAWPRRGCLNSFGLVAADLTEQKKHQEALVAAEKSAREMLEERHQLAQNLHDAVNQTLFSASLIAEVLPETWDRNQAQARQSLEDLRHLTRGAMAEMRALLAELRPSTLTDAKLGDLVRLLGNAFTGRTNIPVKMSVTGEGVPPGDAQVAIYRVCQEALNNIAKHAKAGLVEINLKHEGTALELSVCDDGRGLIPTNKPHQVIMA